ncbi:MAG: siroheme synthase CysG [Alphaproteobacteria bacterium]
MDQLPIFLHTKGKRVAVSGGGTIAARKTETAMKAGAHVQVFAASLSDEFRSLAIRPNFEHVARQLSPTDIKACTVVFAANEDESADRAIAEMAHAAGVLVNVADSPDLSDFIMPSIVDRDPLVIAVSTGGASPVFARMIRARLERTLPAAYGRMVAFVGKHRKRLGAFLKEGAARRRFWERILEGPVADRFMSGHEEQAEAELEKALSAAASGDEYRFSGEVYLVGTGPGDPDLLTFAAQRLMQRADVVLYDRLIPHGILDLVRRDAERIYVGKLAGDHILPQEEISARLVALAKEGKRVLRLKGGDPFMFGRGGEEIEALAAEGIPVTVVPGVTAANGCAAYAGIPLTHRDHAQGCLFVTGHAKSGGLEMDWDALMRPNQTVAVFMGLSQLRQLMDELASRGASPETPVAVIDNGTRPNQRVVTGTMATIAELVQAADLQGPSMIVIGSVVSLREKLFPQGATIAFAGEKA